MDEGGGDAQSDDATSGADAGTTDATSGADAVGGDRVELAVLAADSVGFDPGAFAAAHGLGLASVDDLASTDPGLVADTPAEAVVVVPDGDAGVLPALDALRERTAIPAVLYADDVAPSVVSAFLDADATDYVHRVGPASERALAERVGDAVATAGLAESHDRLERAVDQADVGITIADARADDHPLSYVNEGFARLTGYPVEDAVGRNCRFLQGADTDPSTVAALREAIANGESASVDVLNYRADGEPFWNHLDISPVFDDGELTHYFGFQRDVTERKRLAGELREQNERLEAFASTLSHDLRNPLAVARANLEDVDGDVTAVEAALDRMDALIEDVLALARGGDEVTDPEPVSLPGVATYAWSMVETGDLDLSVPDRVVVHADRDRLAALLENCFRNAVEHATGATTVTVRATDDGFVVADDGPGIPPERRADALDRGYTTDDDGTGFGLAIVAAIADAHDWTVAVAESDDGGTAIVLSDVDVDASD